jgi:hypothetical protein
MTIRYRRRGAHTQAGRDRLVAVPLGALSGVISSRLRPAPHDQFRREAVAEMIKDALARRLTESIMHLRVDHVGGVPSERRSVIGGR